MIDSEILIDVEVLADDTVSIDALSLIDVEVLFGDTILSDTDVDVLSDGGKLTEPL